MILAAAVLPASPPPPVTTRRKPSRGLVVGVGLSALLHAAAGLYLYQQRFVLELEEPLPEQTYRVELERLPPPVIEPERVERTITPPTRLPVREPTVTPADPPIDSLPPAPRVDDTLPRIFTTDPIPYIPDPTPEVAIPEPPAPPAVITDPAWLRLPTAAELERAYPGRALDNEVEGRVTMRCTVTAAGSVEGCSVTEETPRGQGFGRAALSLQSRFQMSPRTRDGQPVGGATVRIPLSFALN